MTELHLYENLEPDLVTVNVSDGKWPASWAADRETGEYVGLGFDIVVPPMFPELPAGERPLSGELTAVVGEEAPALGRRTACCGSTPRPGSGARWATAACRPRRDAGRGW
jgi:hypothetical protein